jgi:recombination protein RecA
MTSKLSDVKAQINKKFGANTVMGINDAPIRIETISSGSLLLDKAVGVGGFPRGRITEVYGPESSGKTTIALQAIANAQKQGLACLYVDIEQALDLGYAKALGVSDDPDLFVFTQPSCGEEVFEIVEDFVNSGTVGIVVVDTVAAMSPRAELEGDISDATMGATARLMGKAMRRLAKMVNEHQVAVLMLNQERATMAMYGSPTTTPGGKALKYAATIRVRLVSTKDKIGKEGAETGQIFTAKVFKNKLAPPFRTCSFQIRYGEGVVLESEIVGIGAEAGLWEKKGGWYVIGENKIQGIDNMVNYVKEVAANDPAKFNDWQQVCKNFVSGIDSVDFTAVETIGE